jgi:mono/diheme cytochrome c family protein
MTSFSRRVLSACILYFGCLIAGLVAATHPAAYASKQEERDHGALLFHSHGCERCHSITGVGGSRAPDLSSVGTRRNADQIRKQILNGGNGMPPFKDIFTKGEVRDLVAFLTSCQTTSPPGCRQWPAVQSNQTQ